VVRVHAHPLGDQCSFLVCNLIYSEWRITYLSSKAEDYIREAMDIPPEAAIEQSLWELVPEASDSIIQEKLTEAMETRETVEFEAKSIVQDGWRSIRAYPSQDGVSVYFTDITPQKERERELEQYETIVETSLLESLFSTKKRGSSAGTTESLRCSGTNSGGGSFDSQQTCSVLEITQAIDSSSIAHRSSVGTTQNG